MMLWAYQQAAAPDVRYYAPWNSPPTFLLIVCVLALLPYPVAAIGFLVGTALFFGYAVRRFLPDGRAMLFPATAPAVIYQVGTVQAGMLIAGISGIALHWLDKRPRRGGRFYRAARDQAASCDPVALVSRAFWAMARLCRCGHRCRGLCRACGGGVRI